MIISLEDIEQYCVPLNESIFNWIFKTEEGQLPSSEYQDQICILTEEAANFLWEYETSIRLVCSDKYFKIVQTWDSSLADEQTIKKYLYNLGIPFKQKVFVSVQPHISL